MMRDWQAWDRNKEGPDETPETPEPSASFRRSRVYLKAAAPYEGGAAAALTWIKIGQHPSPFFPAGAR